MTPLLDRLLDLTIQIQQIPAPTFHEAERASFLRRRFSDEGLNDVEIDTIGNVYARLPGAGDAPPLVVSAHIDTVFPADTDLSIRSEEDKIIGPGIGDNSLGVAGLFGLVWTLRQRGISLPGDLWLVANVCEEGVGDLRGMRAVVDRFGDATLAYIVLEGLALGQIYHRGLGVRRYRISTHTEGGHSWAEYGKPSAIHQIAGLVTALDTITLPETPRTSLNVGTIAGGTSVNTIAARACIELDLRSEKAETLSEVVKKVEALVTESCRDAVRFEMETIGDRPIGEIKRDHPLVQLAKQALEAEGIEPNFNIGSTDANIPLSRGMASICIGLTVGGGAHTMEEHLQIKPIRHGLEQLVTVVTGCWEAGI
jgi:acetylornithine deacetylase/succinyl-diaminopimelate desuccinylase-like protein